MAVRKVHPKEPNASWLHPRLRVGRSRIHGRGVLATARLRRGERLAIFGGDVMRIDEIDDLPPHVQEYPMQIEERFVLGSRRARKAEPADFFNHSCDPNAGFRGQIFLVAMRDAALGEEVTFDYAMVVSPSVGSCIRFEMDCQCGSPRCRGSIAEDDWRQKALQRRYRGFFSWYLEEKIAALAGAARAARRR